jgi:hypothetical protein
VTTLWHPSLAEIQSDPELAILAALHASIRAAALAIGAANPELADPDHLAEADSLAADLLLHASTILTDLDLLARSIDAYRLAAAALVAAHRRHISDDDFPF